MTILADTNVRRFNLQVIQGLGPLRWRGSEHWEFDDASFGFQLRQNRVPYPYVDAAGHEFTGMEPLRLPVNLFFYNSLREDAFPGLWNEWWTLFQDGKPGELEHPLAGIFDAVVTGGNVRLVAQATAGITALVTFERHVEDPEEEQFIESIGVDIEAAAQAADEAASAIDITVPSQADVTSLLDAVAIIESTIATAELRAEGAINQTKSYVDGMIQLARKADDALNYAAQDALIALWTALDDTAKSLGESARDTGVVITSNPTTLDQFARERGMTLAEAITLNPGALGAPGIDPGTMLKFFA